MSLIELERISIYRGKRELLRDVSFTVDAGEFVVMIGPNGVGKSSLLEVVTGDLPHQSGQLQLFGTALSDWPLDQLALRRAVMRQSIKLELPFTVGEVVMMGRAPHIQKRRYSEDRSICHQALKMVDLCGFTERIYTELSGGEQRRVQLARVLAQVWTSELMESDHHSESTSESISSTARPNLLLLDEPIANLDLEAQHRFMSCVQRFTRVGGGALCVVHDLNIAAQYASRVIVFGDHQLLADGTPAQTLTPELIGHIFRVQARCFHIEGLDYPIITTQAR